MHILGGICCAFMALYTHTHTPLPSLVVAVYISKHVGETYDDDDDSFLLTVKFVRSNILHPIYCMEYGLC